MRDEGDWTDRRVKPAVDFFVSSANFPGNVTNKDIVNNSNHNFGAWLDSSPLNKSLFANFLSGKILLPAPLDDSTTDFEKTPVMTEFNHSSSDSQITATVFGLASLKALLMIVLSLFLGLAIVAPEFASGQTEEVEQQERKEIEAFFEDAHESLDAALKLFDDAQRRPEEDDLAFYDFLSRTKESQERKVEGYLDAAGEALGISSISDRRNRISDLREKIADTRRDLTVFQRKRISAPEQSKYNPLIVTKSGYDKKIQTAKDDIVKAEADIVAEKEQLVVDLNRIGMKLDPKSIDNLLESITGDEFVRVSIIFDNAKQFAAELERLTNESGEDLEAAKKYYGVYLMLLKTVSRLQEKFVENVDGEYYPKLDKFAETARANINEAKRAIELGGDETVLRSNINSNQLTYDAANFYKQGLAHQKHQMMMANLETKKNILTAANTYKTVALSKDVAALMAVSRRAFDSISGLSVPDLRPFQNEKMKEAFGQMTRELRK